MMKKKKKSIFLQKRFNRLIHLCPLLVTNGVGTVVEFLPRRAKVKGSSLAAGAGNG
jgi:hypothetical protein